MENEPTIDEFAAFWNLSSEEIACAIAGIKRSFKEIASVLRDLAKRINDICEAVQDYEKQDQSFFGTGQTVSLREFLCLINEAHRLAIEEDKKPPDRKIVEPYRK